MVLSSSGKQALVLFTHHTLCSCCALQPCIVFVGEKFESDPALKQLRSTLLDYFRGEQVSAVNLAGLDRVIMAVAASETKVLLRQYVIKLKKSGTKVPRIALTEMGPVLDLVVRRHRAAPADLEKEACRQPLLGKRKVRKLLLRTQLNAVHTSSAERECFACSAEHFMCCRPLECFSTAWLTVPCDAVCCHRRRMLAQTRWTARSAASTCPSRRLTRWRWPR